MSPHASPSPGAHLQADEERQLRPLPAVQCLPGPVAGQEEGILGRASLSLLALLTLAAACCWCKMRIPSLGFCLFTFPFFSPLCCLPLSNQKQRGRLLSQPPPDIQDTAFCLLSVFPFPLSACFAYSERRVTKYHCHSGSTPECQVGRDPSESLRIAERFFTASSIQPFPTGPSLFNLTRKGAYEVRIRTPHPPPRERSLASFNGSTRHLDHH